jgi:hypothetical protein
MKNLKKLCVIHLTCLALTANAGAQIPSVNYGGDEIVDACGTYAQVVNLGKDPSEFLAVRNAPNIKATRTDKLSEGQFMWICDEQKDWYGVVYTKEDRDDCGVSSVVMQRKAYAGPCKAGWVNKKYVKIVAG